MLLVVSSHDAHDTMDFHPTVGVHKSYPNKNYWCGYAELFDRYIKPRLIKVKTAQDPDERVLAASEGRAVDNAKSIDGTNIVKSNGTFNPGFEQLKALADSAEIPLIIYLHPDKKEFQLGEYNAQGQEIIAWAKTNNVPLYRGIDEGEALENFRDGIHLNDRGQRALAIWITRVLSEHGITGE